MLAASLGGVGVAKLGPKRSPHTRTTQGPAGEESGGGSTESTVVSCTAGAADGAGTPVAVANQMPAPAIATPAVTYGANTCGHHRSIARH
jgi:hypothetical protein